MAADTKRSRDDLRRAESFFDFINVELYTNPDWYTVKLGMPYWIWSEKKQELQEYHVTEGLRYDMIEEYVNRGLVYVD